MSGPVRLLAFGAALLAVFVLALLGARTLLPAGLASSRAGTSGGPGGASMEHGSDPAPSPAPEHTDSGGPAAATPDPVRGLSVAQGGYRLEALTAPPRGDRGGLLSFRLTGPDGRPVTGYRAAHEKDLHLVVVRSDGTWFRHVHPRLDGAGTWSLPWRWAAAGSYRVYADFVPAATGENLTLTSTVEVAGALTPAPLGPDTTRVRSDGYTVELAGAPAAGTSSALTFTVTRDGRPASLQPYLGAAGHLVALRAGDLAYLHVHPADSAPAASGGQVAFRAEVPTPGRYLLYLDFRVDGQVHTARFTTTAR